MTFFIASYIALNIGALCVAIEFGIQPLFFKDALGMPIYSPYSLSAALGVAILLILFKLIGSKKVSKETL